MNAVWTDHGTVGVDLGDEPPLVTTDNRSGPPDRRSVSLRWLAGTVLAALASTSLMGGALYVALDGQQSMARPISDLPAMGGGADEDVPADLVAKGDLLLADAAEEPTRQVLRVSTITRDGERDIIRLKPFARVKAPLVASTSAIVDPIPDYNPLRIFADANVDTGGSEDVLYGADVDGAMAVKVTDFPVADPTLEPVAVLDLPATEQVVREAAQFLGGTAVQVAALPLIDQARFDFGFAERSSFEQFGVRIIPENVSFVATTADADADDDQAFSEEKVVTAEKGDKLEELLTANEATDDEAGGIALAFRKEFAVRALEPGDKLRIALAEDDSVEGATRYRPVRVSLYRDGAHVGTVAATDRGDYMAAAEIRDESPDLFEEAAEKDESPRPRLYESLYQTALSNQMSSELIDELVRIFSFDLDFNTRVQPGDGIEVVYGLDENEAENPDVSEIVYTAVTLGGKERRFYRFKAPDDGTVDYYDAEGRSAKKFLLRKPMSGGTFRSGFGSRRHPLLGYVRAHTGVDWAAPRGTPIMAAGDGVVSYADWKSGYGNYIEIRHNNGYSTAYAHQTGFAKGIRKGAAVRQGQVIGYVGSTGLSTGPHLHYEVHVNDNPVDPMRIKLPRGRTLDGDVLATFQTERERIDTLLGGGQPAKLAAAAEAAGG
jgi:murein DD-endopeptidase MepM/ murein hydrolase activator NlpD